MCVSLDLLFVSRGRGVAWRAGGLNITHRFVVKPWSPLCHSVYPRSFRNAVVTVLMANGREDALPSALPPVLWMEVRVLCSFVFLSVRVCMSVAVSSFASVAPSLLAN